MDDFDHLYAVDMEKLEAVRAQKPWVKDAKYCKKVMISPSATIKMMMHGQSGVERGIKQNGKPIEIMGLLLGRPNPEDPRTIIISDAQPLPIEGMETRVVADDENVQNYMISLVEMNEQSGTRDIFCGWYHTHPFEVDVQSHCYLSGTDVSTQLQWQRAEDHHGNPWVSIVIDPLRSLHKGRPELQAYRVFPPDYSGTANETPDGKIVMDDKVRVERWGVCWNRYYTLETHYYMSNLAQRTLSTLKNNFLWMNALTTTSALEPEAQHSTIERVAAVTDKLEFVELADVGNLIKHLHSAREESSKRRQRQMAKLASGRSSSADNVAGLRGDSAAAATKAAAELAVEQCQGLASQITKKMLF